MTSILCDKKKPNMLFLSETRTTAEIDDAEISIDNYMVIRCNSLNRRTGGVCIYVKNNIGLPQIVMNKNADSCWFLNIKLNAACKIIIYDLSSKEILQTTSKAIDMTAFENGIYIVKVYNNEGLIAVKKVCLSK